LRYAPMWTQPTASERPAPCHRMHRDGTEAIAIVIARALAPALLDALRGIAPGRQAGLPTVLIGIDTCAWHAGVCAAGLDRLWLPLVQELAPHWPTTLPPATARRPLRRHCASAAWALESALPSLSALLLSYLWLSCRTSHHSGRGTRACA